MPLRLVPCSIKEAKAFVRRHHRHHEPSDKHYWAVAVADGDEVVGVAIVGPPTARMSAKADPWLCEVRRVCVLEGHRNASSMLYGACWRAARALGWLRCQTYTLPEEGGTSLRASGWRLIGEAGGGTWNRKSRPRVDMAPTQTKWKWEAA